MGWTGMDLHYCEFNKNGSVNKKKTMDREFESWGSTVIKSTMSGGVWYGVVRERDGRAWLVVSLIHVARGDDEFRYKDMTDTCGPYEKGCPKAILDLADEVCPCTDEYDSDGHAKAWREACRENLRIKDSPTAFKNVRPGESVLWHIPEDSGVTCGGMSLAGCTVKLTKKPGKRQWRCHELRARVATKMVNPLDCELLAADDDEFRKLTHIRDWYLSEYPTDPLGFELNADVTFKQLYDRLASGCDVYEVMGVGDSLVRERMFEHLAMMSGVDYGAIYEMWMAKAV